MRWMGLRVGSGGGAPLAATEEWRFDEQPPVGSIKTGAVAVGLGKLLSNQCMQAT